MTGPDLPYRATANFDWSGLLALMQRAFAGMDGRIDPPSSLTRLTPTVLAASPEVWVMGHTARACMVLTPRPGHLYLGKLPLNQQIRARVWDAGWSATPRPAPAVWRCQRSNWKPESS